MTPSRPASGDTIYVIHAYGSVTNSMSMLACQYSQPKRPGDLESGVRVTCDVGYLCANFSLPKTHRSRRRPDVRDRQTSDRQTDVRQHHRLMPPGRGHNNDD